MIKKIIKYTIYTIGLVVAATAFWYWDTLYIFFNNKAITGTVDGIPQVRVKVLPPITSGANDWLNWQGPHDNNSTTVDNFSTDLASGLAKVWEINYLCQSSSTATWSAPVIKGNRLIACGRTKTDDIVLCLHSETGELLWKGAYTAKAGTSYGKGFRSTPWIDNDRVYTYGRSGDLVCWNLLDGKNVWHTNVKDEGGKEPRWGMSSSPLVTDSAVIVGAGGTARTIAYNKTNGTLKWKTAAGGTAYTALVTMPVGETKLILDFHATGLAALDPATGKQLWNTPWITSYDVNATTPVFSGNKIFITSGYDTGCQLLEVDRDSVNVLWKNRSITSHHSDPFIINDYIFGYSGQSMQNRGSFKCLDMKTGSEQWSTDQLGWGTAIKVNEYLLCLDIKGNLNLIKPNPEKPEIISTVSKILGKVKGAAWTKPIIANNKLYVRSKQKLVCYQFSK